jgi:hypothetical protein
MQQMQQRDPGWRPNAPDPSLVESDAPAGD